MNADIVPARNNNETYVLSQQNPQNCELTTPIANSNISASSKTSLSSPTKEAQLRLFSRQQETLQTYVLSQENPQNCELPTPIANSNISASSRTSLSNSTKEAQLHLDSRHQEALQAYILSQENLQNCELPTSIANSNVSASPRTSLSSPTKEAQLYLDSRQQEALQTYIHSQENRKNCVLPTPKANSNVSASSRTSLSSPTKEAQLPFGFRQQEALQTYILSQQNPQNCEFTTSIANLTEVQNIRASPTSEAQLPFVSRQQEALQDTAASRLSFGSPPNEVEQRKRKQFPLQRSPRVPSTKLLSGVDQNQNIDNSDSKSKFKTAICQTDCVAVSAKENQRPCAFPVPLLKNSDCERKPPISPSSVKRFAVKNSPTKPKNILGKEEEYKKSTKNEHFSSFNELVSSQNQYQEYFKSQSSSNYTKLESSENISSSGIRQSPKSNRKLEDTPNFGAVKKVSSPSKLHVFTEEESPANLNVNLGANFQNRPSSLDLQPNDINLSVNVNCSVDVVTTPPRKQTSLQITPELSWCQDILKSPRSFTSVNLTLRTPTSEPQPPIDICSANSSLTYSTSSFNPKQGLQSRLQITVGPTGIGNVTSVRSRPRSSYHPEVEVYTTPVRAGSMPDLATTVPDTKGELKYFLF